MVGALLGIAVGDVDGPEFVASLVDIADGGDVGAFVECGKVYHLVIIYCFMSYIQALLLLAMQFPTIMPRGALFI